jgi:hypothetical protein
MPIVVRRGRSTAEPRSRLLRFERPTGVAPGATAIGTTPPGPDLRHELARLALELVVRTAEPADLPARWTSHPFCAEVDRTRAQLAPIRSRAGLIASFSREASIAVTRTSDGSPPPIGPVRIAYAICWLELGDGRRRPAWPVFAAGPAALVAAAIDLPLAAAPDQRNGEITT